LNRNGWLVHSFPREVPTPAPVQREAIALIFVAVSEPLMVLTRLGLRLVAAGDEGRQPVDVALGRGSRRLRARRVGRLLADRVSLLLAHRIGLRFARQVGLRLARAERHLAGAGHPLRARHVVAIVETVVAHVARLVLGPVELGIGLTELLLGGGDQAKVMLGVLEIVLRRHRIAGRLRVARELEIFFGNVRWSATNFDIGSIRLEHPGHRILALAVASTHPLVLTVSHDSPCCHLGCDGSRPPCFLKLIVSSSSWSPQALRAVKHSRFFMHAAKHCPAVGQEQHEARHAASSHAASSANRRVVRFRNREAATPGPRSTPQCCPPLVRHTSGKAQQPRRQSIATCAEPMKHLVPDEANSPPKHPA
jgi:hypothetical protein